MKKHKQIGKNRDAYMSSFMGMGPNLFLPWKMFYQWQELTSRDQVDISILSKKLEPLLIASLNPFKRT